MIRIDFAYRICCTLIIVADPMIVDCDFESIEIRVDFFAAAATASGTPVAALAALAAPDPDNIAILYYYY